MSYADELSVKLSARDEMSEKLRGARKELIGIEKEMAKARKDFQDTGSKDAAEDLKRAMKDTQRNLLSPLPPGNERSASGEYLASDPERTDPPGPGTAG